MKIGKKERELCWKYFTLQLMDFEKYMHRCLVLAHNGLGRVAPNPMVGAVIVHNDAIIGEGYHRQYGTAHAEVNAIESVKNKDLLRESVLFVNLEPCSHHGKTPPCADLIVNHKIPKVVVAMRDPNPKVAGRGIQRLKDAGVEVIEGVCHDEALFLNRRFITFHTQKRPYIILKWAQSDDGFIDRDRHGDASRKINWISHPETKKLVHMWRSQEPAILVGKQTIINDNPRLDTREVAGKSPLRIVLSPSGKIPENSHVIQDGKPTLIFNSGENKKVNGAQWVKVDGPFLKSSLEHLYEMGISSVLIEGGATTLQGFIDAGYWDEARIIQSAIRLESGLKAPQITAREERLENYGRDLIRYLYNF